jgi:hypothetical protein
MMAVSTAIRPRLAQTAPVRRAAVERDWRSAAGLGALLRSLLLIALARIALGPAERREGGAARAASIQPAFP